MASPANSVTSTFIITMEPAEPGRFWVFGRYELYVTMTETPSVNVKNACPKAYRMDSGVKSSKCGTNKNLIPSTA